MSDLNFGTIITGDAHRDAVHVAVAPVIADEILWPAQHVGLKAGSCDTASSGTAPVGIVDPYLRDRVQPGQKFWLFLYPKTVTGMRHEWEHPAFGQRQETGEHAKAVQWLTVFAEDHGMGYHQMLLAATIAGYIHASGFSISSWDDCPAGSRDKFWNCMEIVMGRKFDENHRSETKFSCSC